jgi:hypothetical protein
VEASSDCRQPGRVTLSRVESTVETRALAHVQGHRAALPGYKAATGNGWLASRRRDDMARRHDMRRRN